MPLPLSVEDNKALVDLIDKDEVLLWMDVIVSESNVYNDDNGNRLSYVANLNDIEQGSDGSIFI